jgi:hypothetical protein
VIKVKSPSVYLDTNIFSFLHYRGGNLFATAWSLSTRDWWDNEREHFHLYSSATSFDELSAGIFDAQDASIAEVARIPFLPLTKKTRELAALLIEKRIVPQEKKR